MKPQTAVTYQARTTPTVHPIVSLPLPPDEMASAEPAPHAPQPESVTLTASAKAPARPIELPEPQQPSATPTLTSVSDLQPASAVVEAPARRLLTTPRRVEPAPLVKPAPYVLPNHVLPLALELQIATSLNAGGKGPLTADVSYSFHLEAAGAGIITTTLDHPPSPQWTNTAPGVLISFGRRSAPWLDFDINYQFSRFTESYAAPNQAALATIPVNFHEISAEYLHTWWDDPLSTHRVRPFAGLGGGALLFTSTNSTSPTQTRPAGIVDLGVDIPLPGERFSLRIKSHTLIYKAPDFNSSALSSNRWVVSTEPALGLNVRF